MEELEEAVAKDPSLLTKEVKAIREKWKLLPAFLKVRGLVKQQIDSFNYLVNVEIKKIVKAKGNERISCDADPNFFLRYLDVRVGSPSIQENYVTQDITPHQCRLRDLTYAAPIRVDIEFTRGKEIITKRDVLVGRLPIMLRSDRCVLRGKDEPMLAKLGECPLDPGGYFVVKGTEKVILIQEQPSKNRIIIDMDADNSPTATIASSDNERKTLTKLAMHKGVFVLRHNSFADRKGVNMAIVFKAMGVESDQELLQLTGQEGRFAALLSASIQDAKMQQIFTQQQALEYIGRKAKAATRPWAGQRRKLPADDARDILANLVLSHIPCVQFNYQRKVLYLAFGMRRMMYAMLDPNFIDDRDYYGNKRLELAGGQLSLLFEDLFKRLNADLRREAERSLSKQARTGVFDISKHMTSTTITAGLESAITTGNWTIKRFRMERKGVSQVLNRLSFIASLGMMTRVLSQFEKTRKVSGPRALQPSQWGMLCPADTPEGESCGLVKNLALMTHISTEDEEAPIVRAAHLLGVQPCGLVYLSELHERGAAVVHMNGQLLGVHRSPATFVDRFRRLRRSGRVSAYVSIWLQDDCVFIASDNGRVCRPLIICDRGQPRVTQDHVDRLLRGDLKFSDFVAQGLVEFLDVNEENNSLIALYEHQLTAKSTHLEIEPFTIMGVCAGLIPFPHHNQSPRNTYQCAMGKQAMGNIAYNQLSRMDTLLYLLAYPMRPLVTTRTIELIGFDKLGAGQNATIAVMSFSGYDIEDAIVMNRASLDRGFGRCIVLKKFGASLKRYPNQTVDRIARPPPAARLPGGGYKGKYRAMGDDGLAEPGQVIQHGDVYMVKQTPLNTRDVVPGLAGQSPSGYRTIEPKLKAGIGEQCVVDKVLMSSNDDSYAVVKILIRHTRRPELGDKFSSRHGQKGVCGLIVPQEDLPFSERGICPDLIMNPHGFPSRMTVGKMIELLGSKAAVLSGSFNYGTAFGEPGGLADKVEDMSATLVGHGFDYCGKDYLTSGITGEPLEAYVFMGPVYYQKLKHMVLDKMHARARGPRTLLTRQPTEGRSRDGGLRLGEMERDCLIAYGAANLLQERLVISSDGFKVWVDTRSGLLGHWDELRQRPVSPLDGTSADMRQIRIPYACKLLFQELQAMNVVPRIRLKEL